MKKRVSLEEYKRRAQAYFDGCDAENSDRDPKQPLAKPYTLSGLLYALELTREDFKTLERSREGRRFVNQVLMKIEAFIEENALSGRLSAAVAQGALKYSFGWGERALEESTAISVTLSEEAEKLGE